jgi:hypothetical protein
VIKCCRYILQLLWNCILWHKLLKVVTPVSIHNWTWCSELVNTYCNMSAVSFFFGAYWMERSTKQVLHHQQSQTKYVPGDCIHSCRHFIRCICQFEASHIVHGCWGQPHPAPDMMGCSSTRTEVCTYNIWSPSMHKLLFYCWKSGTSSEMITL